MPRPKLTRPDKATPEGQLALYLDHLMKERNIKPEELAEAIDASRSIVFRWLSGGCTPSFRFLPMIAQRLGLAKWQDIIPPQSFVDALETPTEDDSRSVA